MFNDTENFQAHGIAVTPTVARASGVGTTKVDTGYRLKLKYTLVPHANAMRVRCGFYITLSSDFSVFIL